MVTRKTENVKAKGKKKEKEKDEPEIERRINKWTEKKQMTKAIADKLFAIEMNDKLIEEKLKARATRMRFCSTQLELYVCPECGHTKLKHANYCRDRLCPICRWRLSMQRYSFMSKIFNYLVDHKEEYGTFKFTMLTLTVKNCKPKDLSDTIKKMSKAWDRMCKRKHFKENIAGWARSLEVTYNKSRHTMHPHYHIMLMWDSKTKIDETTQQKTFQNIWKETCDLDYYPQVKFSKVRQLRKAKKRTKLQNAVLETFKYCVKDKEMDDMPLGSFRELALQLNGKRLVSFGGLLKEIKALLNVEMDELEEGEDIDLECNKCGAEMAEMILRWSFDDNTYKRYRILNGEEVEEPQEEEETEQE